jgi:hypothetical protein
MNLIAVAVNVLLGFPFSWVVFTSFAHLVGFLAAPVQPVVSFLILFFYVLVVLIVNIVLIFAARAQIRVIFTTYIIAAVIGLFFIDQALI